MNSRKLLHGVVLSIIASKIGNAAQLESIFYRLFFNDSGSCHSNV